MKRTLNGGILESVPAPIAAALARLRKRTRRIILIRGLCAAAAALLALTLLAMSADLIFTMHSAAMRWIASSIIYAGTAFAAYRFLVSALGRSQTAAGLALMVEARHPEMQERLSSAVELLTTTDNPESVGSRKLIEALAEAAAADAEKISPKDEISIRAAAPHLAAAAAVALLFAALFAASPAKTSSLMKRSLIPFANLPSAGAMDLEIAPGDAFVGRGQRLDISVSSKSFELPNAKIRRIGADGTETVDEMRKSPGKEESVKSKLMFTLDAVQSDFRYRIESGRAVSRYYSVAAVTPPAIEKIDLRIDYPEYARMAPRIENGSEGNISGLAGSVATISLAANKECRSAELKIGTGNPKTILPEANSTGRNLVFKVPLQPGISGRYSIHLLDEHGLGNPAFERTVQTLLDVPPVAAIADPGQDEIRIRVGEKFPFQFMASDDIGLSSVRILLEKDSSAIPPRPVQITPDSQSENGNIHKFEGSAVADPADPELKGASSISFQIAASDNLPGDLKGPQTSFSRKYRIIIDNNAKPFGEQALNSQKETLGNMLAQAKRELEESRRSLNSVKEAASKEGKRPDQLAERSGALRESIGKADSTLRGISETLSGGFFENAAESVRRLREDEVSKAQGFSERMPLAENPQERVAIAEKMDGHIARSISSVEEMLKKYSDASKAMEFAMQVKNLAESEEDLAKRKMELDGAENPDSPENRKKLEEWRREQDKLADSVARIAREKATPEALGKTALHDEAARISREAERLSDEQNRILDILKGTAGLGEMQRRLGELSVRQAAAAEFAKSDNPDSPAWESMKGASEKILAGEYRKAADLQEEAAAILGESEELVKKESVMDPWKRPESPEDAMKNFSDIAENAAKSALSSSEKASDSLKAASSEAEKLESELKAAQKNSDKNAAAALAEKSAIVKDLAQKAKESSAKAAQNSAEARRLADNAAQIAPRLKAASAPAEKWALVDQAEQMARDARENAKAAEYSAVAADTAARLAGEIAKDGAQRRQELVGESLALSEKSSESSRKANEEVAESAKKLDEAWRKIQNLENFRREAERKFGQEFAAGLADKLAALRREEAMAKKALEGARRAAAGARQAAEQAASYAKSAAGTQDARNSIGQALESARKSLEAEQQAQAAGEMLGQMASDRNSIRGGIAAELSKTQDYLNRSTKKLLNEQKDFLASIRKGQNARLERRQDAVAEESAKIAALAEKKAPGLADDARKAGESAAKTKESIVDSDAAQSAKDAADASGDLAKLADGLQAEALARLSGSPDDSAAGAEIAALAERAGAAAEEQRQIGEELSALREDKPLDQLEKWQEGIRKRAEDLKKNAESLQTSSREMNLPQKSQQLAAEGTRELQNSAQNSEGAVKTISRIADENSRARNNPAQPVNEKLSDEAIRPLATSAKSLGEAARKMAQLAEEKTSPEAEEAGKEDREAARIADEARELSEEQSRLTGTLLRAQELQDMDRKLDELHCQQKAAAEIAKVETRTSPAAEIMGEAADKMAGREIAEAASLQDKAAEILSEAANIAEKEMAGAPWKRPDSPSASVRSSSARAEKARAEAAKSAEKAGKAVQKADSILAESEKLKTNPGENSGAWAEEEKAERNGVIKLLAGKAREEKANSDKYSAETANAAEEVLSAAKSSPQGSEEEKEAHADLVEQKSRAAARKAALAEDAAKAAEAFAEMASELAKDAPELRKYQQEKTGDARKSSEKAVEAAESANESLAGARESSGKISESIAALDKLRDVAQKNSNPELAARIEDKVAEARRSQAMAGRALEWARNAAEASSRAAEDAKAYSDAASKNANPANAALQAAEALRKSSEAEQQAQLADSFVAQFAADEHSARRHLGRELLEMQNLLSGKMMELMNSKKSSAAAARLAQAAELERRQAGLEKEVEDIAGEAAKLYQPASQAAEQAKGAAGRTKDSLRSFDLPRASTESEQSAGKLQELSTALRQAPAPAGTPSGNNDTSSKTADLAARSDSAAAEQRMLHEEIKALAGGKPLDQLALWQKNIAARAEDLGNDSRAIVKDGGKGEIVEKARQAEQNFQGARKASEKSAESISEASEQQRKADAGRTETSSYKIPEEAVRAQDSSARLLAEAADSIEDVQAAKSSAAPSEPRQADLPLASALARMASNDQKEGATEAIRSAGALRDAAADAMDKASAAGVDTSPERIAVVRNSSAQGAQKGPSPEEALGDAAGSQIRISYEDWLRLPAKTRSEILQSSSDGGPEEYRTIIRRYFEELSRLGTERQR